MSRLALPINHWSYLNLLKVIWKFFICNIDSSAQEKYGTEFIWEAT